MKILAVKLADFGDLLLSEPALRSLRHAYPEAQIDVLTTPHAAQLIPYFHLDLGVVTFDKARFDLPGLGALQASGKVAAFSAQLRSTAYDRVALLHHLTTSWGAAKFRGLALAAGAPLVAGLDNGRGSFLTHAVVDRGFGHKHETAYMLEVAQAAGGLPTDEGPRFFVQPESTPASTPKGSIAIAPVAGGYSSARIWPPEHYIELSRLLVDRGHNIVVVGGADAVSSGRMIREEIGPEHVTDLTGKTSINQLALVFQHSALVVGNDSFPVHLASALDRPVLAIFGPSNARAWAPQSPAARILTVDLPCSPCLYTGYRLGRREGCPSRTCLTMVTPEMAFAAALELLGA